MKILAFAASSSRKSINAQLLRLVSARIEGHEIEFLDINDYEMPLFSEDREDELGQPALAQAFREKISECDLLLISFAEHNGSYTAAWKNLFDWTSRIAPKVFQSKRALYFATSPGLGGAANVLQQAVTSAPHFGAELLGSLSVPSFYDNVDTDSGRLADPELEQQLEAMLEQLTAEPA